jgi:hypothetical protein
MPPSTKSDTPRRSCGSHTTGRCVARAITRLLSACLDRVRAILADLAGRDDGDPDRRGCSLVTTIATLRALGWHVTELRPSIDAPALWRVTIKRFDGAVSIIVLDATDPDAAFEELARYAAADAEDLR